MFKNFKQKNNLNLISNFALDYFSKFYKEKYHTMRYLIIYMVFFTHPIILDYLRIIYQGHCQESSELKNLINSKSFLR